MKHMQGVVTRVNDERTAKIEVERRWIHPVYKKYFKRTKNYLVHIPENTSVAVGDFVMVESVAPISKTKKFIIIEKIEQTKQGK
jgi:small subunit ribosomal protein S17